VDGVRRSLDGGETWETIGAAVTPGKIGRQLNDPDIHGIAVSGTSPTTVFVSTPREIFASTDAGESWQPLGVKNHFPHAHQAKALIMDLLHRVRVDTYWDAFSVGSSGTPRPGSA
jgi:hypothetical protein